jgi:hypothetical protein
VLVRWEPGVRRESFIQGVKMADLCGKSAAADPFLSREATLCSKEYPLRTGSSTRLKGKVLQGFTFSFRLPWRFFFPFLCKEELIISDDNWYKNNSILASVCEVSTILRKSEWFPLALLLFSGRTPLHVPAAG